MRLKKLSLDGVDGVELRELEDLLNNALVTVKWLREPFRWAHPICVLVEVEEQFRARPEDLPREVVEFAATKCLLMRKLHPYYKYMYGYILNKIWGKLREIYNYEPKVETANFRKVVHVEIPQKLRELLDEVVEEVEKLKKE